MLKRFGNVLWWLGLLVGCLATAPYLYSLYLHAGCDAVVALQADIDRSDGEAMARYQKEHPSSDAVDFFLARQAQPTRAASSGATGLAAQFVKDAGAAAPASALDALIARDGAQGRYVLIDERSTPEHEQRLRNCKQAVDALGLFAGWAFALVAWALAYVVGGRFWRPSAADLR